MSSKTESGKATFWFCMVVCLVIGVGIVTRSIGWMLISIPFAIFAMRQIISD